MKLRLTVATFLVLVAGPAFAAEFYVAQNPTTKGCKIVTKKPKGQPRIMIGSPYATRADAKAAKKAAVECKKKKPSSN